MAVLVLLAALFAAPQAAMAWEPFTHNFIGDQVWPQAASGQATVGQRTYPLPPGLAAALRDHCASYNGGVVGPDGFPDITFGQSQVHPNHTGTWLRYLMQNRTYAPGTSPGGFAEVVNHGSFSLPSGVLAGNRVVEVGAEDPCGSSSTAETLRVL